MAVLYAGGLLLGEIISSFSLSCLITIAVALAKRVLPERGTPYGFFIANFYFSRGGRLTSQLPFGQVVASYSMSAFSRRLKIRFTGIYYISKRQSEGLRVKIEQFDCHDILLKLANSPMGNR